MEQKEPPRSAIGYENTASVVAKAAIRKAGGGTLARAVAMLEDRSLEARYPFGDIAPDGRSKLLDPDAANFGIYKMNWGMIRRCPWASGQTGGFLTTAIRNMLGMRINKDPGLATRILLEAWTIWDLAEPAEGIEGNFWAGHRGGQRGLEGRPCVPAGLPGGGWEGILEYYSAVQAIKRACDLDPAVWSSRVRYYIFVPPI